MWTHNSDSYPADDVEVCGHTIVTAIRLMTLRVGGSSCGHTVLHQSACTVTAIPMMTLRASQQMRLWTHSSVQVKMVSVTCAKGKCPSLRSNASLRCFPNVAFGTVPMFVWLTMALFRPLNGDRRRHTEYSDIIILQCEPLYYTTVWQMSGGWWRWGWAGGRGRGNRIIIILQCVSLWQLFGCWRWFTAV